MIQNLDELRDKWAAGRAARTRRMSDLLFAEDGTVRLPKWVDLAFAMAKAGPSRCLSRQPTRERAEAVMAAARPIADKRGDVMEIRPGRDSWGLYLVPPNPAVRSAASRVEEPDA